MIGHDCPCGTPHELAPSVVAAYGEVTAGLSSTVTVLGGPAAAMEIMSAAQFSDAAAAPDDPGELT